MGYLVSALLIGLCLYLILRPFFNQKTGWQTDELKDDLDTLSLEQIYATLNEAEMEYNMGKLPEEDYNLLKRQYEQIAAAKLKAGGRV